MRRALLILFSVTVVAAVVFGPALASAAGRSAVGALDPTFGNGGRVVADPPTEPARSHFEVMASEPDGRLVLRLQPEPNTGYKGQEIEMRTAAGVLDPSFGSDGKVVVPSEFGAIVGSVKAEDMAVFRLDPMGKPVSGFGRHGLAVVHFPGGNSGADAGIGEPDGDIVITGWASHHVGAARLRPDGRLDPTFGRHGLVRGLLRPHKFGPIGVKIAPFEGGLVIDAAEERNADFVSAGLIRLDRRGHLGLPVRWLDRPRLRQGRGSPLRRRRSQGSPLHARRRCSASRRKDRRRRGAAEGTRRSRPRARPLPLSRIAVADLVGQCPEVDSNHWPVP